MTDHSKNSPINLPSTTRFWALVPCAGIGTRAGSDGPKQYQCLAGQPMVLHTLAAFAGVARIARTMVVVAAGDQFFASKKKTYLITACGGATRAASVFNGLKALTENGALGNDWVCLLYTSDAADE